MAGSSDLLIFCADLTTLHRTAAISGHDTGRQNTVDAALIEIGEYFAVNGKPDGSALATVEPTHVFIHVVVELGSFAFTGLWNMCHSIYYPPLCSMQ